MMNEVSLSPRRTLRVACVDIGEHDKEQSNIYLQLLRKHYRVELCRHNPDVIFYDCFGVEHLSYQTGIRIACSGELYIPDMNFCDFAIIPCRMTLGDRHLYRGTYESYFSERYEEFGHRKELSAELARRKFCSFIYSQSQYGEGSRLRAEFCRKLSEYAHVDCPGRVLHNIDVPELSRRFDKDWNHSKINFLGGYKFNIAFENCSSPGYITEKLTDAFFADTVPIYWGSDGDVTPFPREAMIVANDYQSLDELVSRVREVNEDDELYMSMLAANPLRNGMTPHESTARLEEFLLSCVEHKPIARDPYGFGLGARVQDVLIGIGPKRYRFMRRMLDAARPVTWGKLRCVLDFASRVMKSLDMWKE